ncbi:unnamed protein product [Staurois parvus]|uniref:Uncharacterized protein n=1 Tax=Staurois parvus TaxID=386267 RepID=A0ABN9GRC4_9NEOB|nr:unnamed protein product [Staurois parvus]
MPKHNSATLTCVSKTVHIVTTTLYNQLDYTLLFSGQIGLSFGGKCAPRGALPAQRQVCKYAAPWKKSPVP